MPHPLNRKVFFAHVRKDPFPGRLTAAQVSGMEDLLDVWNEAGTDDLRHLAYVFATNFHETGQKMQPIRETFAKTDKEARRRLERAYGHRDKNWYIWPQGPHGHVYYGRGDTQLTWLENYATMGEALDVPLVEKPDLALEPRISKRIMVEGMLRGLTGRGDFTGHALEHYFNETTDDPVGARRIVNGTDRAEKIAAYHRAFLAALEAAADGWVAGIEDIETDETQELEAMEAKPPSLDKTTGGGAAAAGAGIIGSLFAAQISPWMMVLGLVALIGLGLVVAGRLELFKETGE